MTTHIAFLLYCILLLGIVVLVKGEHRTQTVPVVQAAVTTGDAADANRLYSPCPLSPKNLPIHREIES